MTEKIGIYYERRNKEKPWAVRWFGEFDLTTEKHRRYCKSFATKPEAEVFKAEKVVEFSKSGGRDKPKPTMLSVFCGDFLKTQRRTKNYRPSTITLYQNTIRRMIEHFGPTTPITKIDRRTAAKFISSLMPFDERDELSNWARDRALRHCKTMFNVAVTWKLIAENPFAEVKVGKCRGREWYQLTPAEYQLLLQAAPTLRRRAIIALAYGCGLRLGEILSLTWANIDFTGNPQVRIENRPASAKTPPFFVKDFESRKIPLPKHVVNILTDLRGYNEITGENIPFVVLNEGQYETLQAKWKRYRAERRGWENRDTQNNTLTAFKRDVKKAGIQNTKPLSLQVLRKNCITNWADNVSNPKVTQNLAGHSDLKTTLEFYTQLSDAEKQEAARTIDELVASAEKVTYNSDV